MADNYSETQHGLNVSLGWLRCQCGMQSDARMKLKAWEKHQGQVFGNCICTWRSAGIVVARAFPPEQKMAAIVMLRLFPIEHICIMKLNYFQETYIIWQRAPSLDNNETRIQIVFKKKKASWFGVSNERKTERVRKTECNQCDIWTHIDLQSISLPAWARYQREHLHNGNASFQGERTAIF